TAPPRFPSLSYRN
ncbi:hypothetical protein AB1N83_012927, partial [Pleurotus pulmonarius]